MNAAWAAVIIAALAVAGALLRTILAAGRREGKIDLLLEQQIVFNAQMMSWRDEHERQHSAGVLNGQQPSGSWEGFHRGGG